jgi:hypothetical protein
MKNKLTKFDRCLAGAILQAPVTEQGMVLDPETKKPLGVCKAPEFRQEKDCVIIDLKAQSFKPLESITCDIVVDRSK